MSSKNISNGIEQIVSKKSESQSQLDLYYQTWRDLRNKLDSSLIRTNVLKGDVIRKICQTLDGMTTNERYEAITQYWGPQHAERSRPLLEQLDKLEKAINAYKESQGK